MKYEKREKDIIDFIDDIFETDPKLNEFKQNWGPLASFLNQYEHLKTEKELTQKDIAAACGTTQSAISRLERMRGKPTYELLRKLSAAVEGKLYLSPVTDVSVTLPLDLQDRARRLAARHGKETNDFLLDILRTEITNAEYRDAFAESDYKILVTIGDPEIPMGEYGNTRIVQGKTSDHPLTDCLWGSAV